MCAEYKKNKNTQMTLNSDITVPSILYVCCAPHNVNILSIRVS